MPHQVQQLKFICNTAKLRPHYGS